MQPVLLFVHIPKTAGTTLRDILSRQYAEDKSLHFNNQDERSDSLTTEEIQQRATDKHLVYGHMAYGFHQYLDRPYQYITVLRDPIAQVISLINHYRRAKNQDNWEGLENFVGDRLGSYQNRQLKMLTHVDTLWGKDVTVDDLKTAKQRLRDEFLVGISERFDETVLFFRHKLKWQMPYYLRLNVSNRHLQHALIEFGTLTQDEQQLLRDWNALDIELYTYAQQLFDEQLAEMGGLSQWQIRRFQWQNQLYYLRTVGTRKVRKFIPSFDNN